MSLSQSALKEFSGKRIHILGVAGTLMGAFASFLKKNGIEVTGSDQNIYPPMSEVLKNAGISVYTPYSKENLEKAKPDLVIVGNVVRKTNPEMQAVVEKNLPYQSLPGALETMILPQKHSVVVAGTHGKTTTASMLAWILESLGEKPSFFVGGVLHNFAESFRVTDSKYMVLEGDEYDTAFFDKVPKFTHYLPKDVILTSVEYDHADIYPDMNAVIDAFDKLAKLVLTDGYFITCGETETPLRIAHRTQAKVVTYGFSETVDSQALKIEIKEQGCVFRWKTSGNMKTGNSEFEYDVKLNATGKHNILNALGCLTWVHLRGLDVEKAIACLADYQGVKRRQEVYGVGSGITLIDDFAHHPTAVRETLLAIRAKYPSSRLIACFEPRSATSRRKVFQAAYAESFDAADLVYLAKPFEASNTSAGSPNPPAAETFSTEDALNDLKKRGKKAKLVSTTPEGIKSFASDLKSGDVVVVMSNGGFDGLLPKLFEFIK